MLYIITPCSRPENLKIISATIPKESTWIVVYNNNIEIKDYINNAFLMKCKETGKVGIKARNFALDNLSLNDHDMILFHDDDNIIHHKLYSSISPYFIEDFSIMTWGQLWKDNSIRLQPENNPRPTKIDTASFLVSWKYNKSIRHEVDVYEHDGIYAESCAKNGKVLCINDYLCYYNYLR